jgi:DNA invertase Pin-like site-specific DNA recombinase
MISLISDCSWEGSSMAKHLSKTDQLWQTWSMRPRRIVLYARVSTKDKGQDTRNQLHQLREFATKQDWTITQEYIDHVSGKSSNNRPQFQAMMKAASMREFDLVLFWSLDRLSREGVLQTLTYLQTLTSYGVGWKSFTEQYLDSCGVFKDAVLSILATIAKQERIRLSERTIAGLEQARRRGAAIGRPRVITDRAKVKALRAAGKSLPAIAREMDLSITTVARICKNAA